MHMEEHILGRRNHQKYQNHLIVQEFVMMENLIHLNLHVHKILYNTNLIDRHHGIKLPVDEIQQVQNLCYPKM